MTRKAGVALLTFAVVFSAVYFGIVFDVPVINDASEKIWNHAEPIIGKAKSFLEESYQKIFGSGFNPETGLRKSTGSSSESLQSVDAPEITVSMSPEKSTYYLGDNPSFEITVTNSGGPCEVNYTAFETQSETGTLHLDSGESEIVTETGRQVKSIGNWNASVEVFATNKSGSDRASDTAYFDVTFHHINGRDYVAESDLNSSWWESFWRSKAITNLESLILSEGEAWGDLANPDSLTVNRISERFASFHPNNRELMAKDIYYWVSNWIDYDEKAWADKIWSETGGEVPADTIYDRDGVCLNYSAVLSSIYEAVGMDAKMILLWNNKRKDYHAGVLLYMSGSSYNRPFDDEWVFLDPTEESWYMKAHPKSSTFGCHWSDYDSSYQGTYSHYDMADVE